jgi:hypothetical protein
VIFLFAYMLPRLRLFVRRTILALAFLAGSIVGLALAVAFGLVGVRWPERPNVRRKQALAPLDVDDLHLWDAPGRPPNFACLWIRRRKHSTMICQRLENKL